LLYIYLNKFSFILNPSMSSDGSLIHYILFYHIFSYEAYLNRSENWLNRILLLFGSKACESNLERMQKDKLAL
jgi:hypothetical protein